MFVFNLGGGSGFAAFSFLALFIAVPDRRCIIRYTHIPISFPVFLTIVHLIHMHRTWAGLKTHSGEWGCVAVWQKRQICRTIHQFSLTRLRETTSISGSWFLQYRVYPYLCGVSGGCFVICISRATRLRRAQGCVGFCEEDFEACCSEWSRVLFCEEIGLPRG